MNRILLVSVLLIGCLVNTALGQQAELTESVTFDQEFITLNLTINCYEPGSTLFLEYYLVPTNTSYFDALKQVETIVITDPDSLTVTKTISRKNLEEEYILETWVKKNNQEILYNNMSKIIP